MAWIICGSTTFSSADKHTTGARHAFSAAATHEHDLKTGVHTSNPRAGRRCREGAQ